MYLHFKKLVKDRILNSVSYPINKEEILLLLNNLEFTLKKEGYNCIIDGANVAYYDIENNNKYFESTNIDVIHNILKKNKLKPLIVLHESHFNKIKFYPKSWNIFKTPRYFNDDLFWLFCTFTANCKLITNDKMRDHISDIFYQDKLPFKIWKNENVCKFKIIKYPNIEEILKDCSKSTINYLVDFTSFKSFYDYAIKRSYLYNRNNKNIIDEIWLQTKNKIKELKIKKKDIENKIDDEKEYQNCNKFDTHFAKLHFDNKISESVIDLLKVTSEIVTDDIISNTLLNINKVKCGGFELEGENILFRKK